MPALISITNRQRTRPLNAAFARRLARSILTQQGIRQFELGLVFVDAREMAAINEQFLNHSGSTDVITFDYSAEAENLPEHHVLGEIVICIDDAIEQSRLFRTSWQSEAIRYVAHGILHLMGYDDLDPQSRKIMKRQENLVMQRLSEQVDFDGLSA